MPAYGNGFNVTNTMDQLRAGAAFRRLHERGCFVFPTRGVCGSRGVLCSTLVCSGASTSSVYAWSPSGYLRISLQTFSAPYPLCNAIDIPVNADFDLGFATDPPRGAIFALRSMREWAGLRSRPQTGRRTEKLYFADRESNDLCGAASTRSSERRRHTLARLRLVDRPRSVTRAIDRLVAFAAGGAALFAPGVVMKGYLGDGSSRLPKPSRSHDATGFQFRMAEVGVLRIRWGGLARVAYVSCERLAAQINRGDLTAPEREAANTVNDIFRAFET